MMCKNLLLLVLSALPAAIFPQTADSSNSESSTMVELREARRLAAESPGEGAPRVIRALGEVGAWAEAERLARRLFERQPTAEHALLLALTLRRQDRIDPAIQVLEASLDGAGAPDGDALRRELALLHLAAGGAERALEVMNAAQTPDPGVRALALAALPARGQDAARALEHALENVDETVVPRQEIVRELGSVLLDRGEPGAALPYLRSSVDTDPDDPDAAYRLGLALRALGQTEAARSTLDRFQELRDAADRRDAERRALGAVLNDAQELAQSNQLTVALEQVDAVIDAFPNSYSALALRAKIRFSLGRVEGEGGALADIRRAARIEPGISEFHYLEGLFARTAGNNPSARTALRRALALDPDLVEAHALLGGIELDLGAPDVALEHLETAVALGASGDQIERAIEIARQRVGATP